jgi:dynein heavy chain
MGFNHGGTVVVAGCCGFQVKDVKNRVASLVGLITVTLFKRVCLSLFERDKLLYSFLICLRVLHVSAGGEVTPEEQRFLLTGMGGSLTGGGGGGKGSGGGGLQQLPNPATAWITKRMWVELQQLSQLPAFKGLSTAIVGAPDAWQKVYESAGTVGGLVAR